MKIIFLSLFCFLLSFNLFSQVSFTDDIKSLNPQKNTTVFSKNKYFLISKKNLPKNEKKVKIIKKLTDNFLIIRLEDDENGEVFSSELYEINNNWKLSKSIKGLLESKKNQEVLISVKTTDKKKFLSELISGDISYKLENSYKNTINIKLNSSDLSRINALSSCTFLDVVKIPKPEAIPFEKVDLSINNVYLLQHNFSLLTGENINVSVKELLFDVDDIDFRNRIRSYGNEANDITNHATIMASIIGGAGNRSSNSKGVAYSSVLSSSDFTSLLPDEDLFYSANNVFVQNHSYGTDIESFYGTQANAYDQSVVDNPSLLHVFSSGNDGELASTDGTYQGIDGYANMTGNFKMAKNVLLVGGVDESLTVNSRSSKGPTYDGRIKPELVAHGPEGTSDAAAIVSGISGLLQQQYKAQNGEYPRASLVKSLLIAGADDVGEEGIDFKSGYGNVNAYKSGLILDRNQYIVDEVVNSQTKEFTINVSSPLKELKVALVWSDIPANVDDVTALVNDIDLELVKDATTWLPWVLDASPTLNSLESPAVRGEDHINNTELITIENPEIGAYTVRVTGNSITSSKQTFSIAYYFKEKDQFKWNFPTASDALQSAQTERISWENNFDFPVTTIEYSLNNGNWQVIDGTANLTTNFFEWNLPNSSGVMQLRALINGNYYVSDTFAVSPVIVPKVDYNCNESVQFSWDEVANATAYEVSILGEKYLVPYQNQTQLTIEIPKTTLELPFVSITPIFNSLKGKQGQTIDYTFQGVNCYYKNFFAFLNDNDVVSATLNLSTLTNVNTVFFERISEGNITVIDEINLPSSELLTANDSDVPGGEILYRARIVLDNGTEILSDEVQIDFPFNNSLSIYPNPVIKSEGMFVFSRGNNLTAQVVDTSGRIMYSTILNKVRQTLAIPKLNSGLYFVQILNKGNLLAVKKVIIVGK